MTALLVVLSLLVAFVGFVMLSNATMGVGLLASAILLAILSRINQAGEHHREAIGARASLPTVVPK